MPPQGNYAQQQQQPGRQATGLSQQALSEQGIPAQLQKQWKRFERSQPDPEKPEREQP